MEDYTDVKELDKMNRKDERILSQLEPQELDIKAFNIGGYSYIIGKNIKIYMTGTGIECPAFNLRDFGNGSIQDGLDMLAVFLDKLYTMYVTNPSKVKLSKDGKLLKKFIKSNLKRVKQ
jgi:hypothetical protein